jgi:ATP-dependent helicase HrpA
MRSGVVFDPALPISAKREEIAASVEGHPVVIVCGETGSGKSTQIPKMLYAMGRGAAGRIGHTQPRRIAARSIAARIAEELKTELGALVGYKVRFQERLGPRATIKVMTDGVLLAETQGDPELRAYDTLVIDEAHERTLNIDFLLGYLKRLVARRPELRVVITSATIDAQKFAGHFDGAPVIEVSGRLYPVEVRYRPVGGDAEDTTREEEEDALADAVEDLCREGPGDILVFLPGEREIRDAADVLRRRAPRRPAEAREVLSLYGRLSSAEQDRVFHPGAARRVVLATNVAETSLTVPRIRYVVDTGLARVKRYSYRNKVEMLRVENVSQAAARQRTGRCGRVADGACVRLYSEDDFNARPPFTDPELLRSSLATVILRALDLRLGRIEDFPFLDAPPPRAIADGYALLAELGAVDENRELTGTGRELARLPLDPRVGRMLVAARDEHCLEPVLVIAAALSVQDPRQRPLEQAAAADEQHARFADERSDFLALLKLWRVLEQPSLRRFCREHFLSLPRLREWRDVHRQLAEALGELGWRPSRVDPAKPEGYAAIHRALLAGLLGNVGLRDEAEGHYGGARGIRFWVHPGSGTRKPGKWIVAAELVDTTRLYARTVATIDAKWLEDIGAHLIRRHAERPHWERSRAQVVAFERGTLYGLPVYVDRRVHYGPRDPVAAREIFLRAALVEGDFETRAPFFAHNQRLVRDIERLEHKSRRPDILVDDELIRAFYDARVPEGIHNGADFERWRRDAERAEPRRLYLSREDLMRHEAAGITTQNFPPVLTLGANRFALEYHFEPGAARDGVTLTVPVALLNQVSAARCEWLVPGLLAEKVQALAKGMPQRLRHKLGALAEFGREFAAQVAPSDTPLAQALTRHLRARFHLDVPPDAFRPDSAPPHLRMNFCVVDEHGRQLGMGRSLAELKRELAGASQQALRGPAAAEAPAERFTAWTFGDLPERMEIQRGGRTLVGYPALEDAGDAVVLQVFEAPEKAREVHRAGVKRLLAIAFRERLRDVEKGALQDMTLAALRGDLVRAALDRCFLAESVPVTEADFARRVAEGRSRLTLVAQELQRLARAILGEHAQVEKRAAAVQKAFPQVAADVRAQCARLLAPGWLARTPWGRLQHLPRYLRAAALRLDKLRADPQRDAQRAAQLAPLEQAYRREYAARAAHGDAAAAELEQFGWLLEELRVSLFAQELKTPVPVSAKRLAKLWQSMRR